MPIVLGEPPRMAANLPFRSSIAWHDVALFGGDVACFTQPQRLAAWLRELLDPRRAAQAPTAPDAPRAALPLSQRLRG